MYETGGGGGLKVRCVRAGDGGGCGSEVCEDGDGGEVWRWDV